MTLAPIAIFCFNRPRHLREVVESLLANPEAAQSRVHFFIDGWRTPEQSVLVEEVRAYVGTVQGFGSITIHARETNFGLARSIITGVTELLTDDERVIVLEDDLIVTAHFLRFMNDALELWSQEPRVMCINGYSYFHGFDLPPTFFLKGGDNLGWGTWRRAWNLLEQDGRKLSERIRSRNLQSSFDRDDTYPYFQMLVDQIEGRNNSWAIRWHASIWLLGGFTLYPFRSLVYHTGFDAGTNHNCVNRDEDPLHVPLHPDAIEVGRIEILERPDVTAAFHTFQLRYKYRLNWKRRLAKYFRDIRWTLQHPFGKEA